MSDGDARMNRTCNVPGCEEPLGDVGVWCEDHYRHLYETTTDG